MVSSHSLSIYTKKAVPQFDCSFWIRFLISLLLLGMCLSEGIAEVLIDIPFVQLIDFGPLINGSYNFDELSVVSLWGNEMGSGALSGVGVSSFRLLSDSGLSVFERDLHSMKITGDTVFHSSDNSSESYGDHRVIDVISVNGETVIDFDGGTRASPNILEVTVLVIPTDEDTLLIKNWVEYSDYFLVSREYAPDDEMLSRIQFKGYGRGAKMRYFNDTYWEIVPAPEAALYGAILGGGALGVFVWRKRCCRRAV